MTGQPIWLTPLIILMELLTFASFVGIFFMIFWSLWEAWKKFRNGGGEDGSWGPGRGGKDWRPTGRPPGGGGPDPSDYEISQTLDLIGRQIRVEEKEEEAVPV